MGVGMLPIKLIPHGSSEHIALYPIESRAIIRLGSSE